ncbi:MAG: hypothetical protein ACOY82_17775 [Pseudomonadota bacterium]
MRLLALLLFAVALWPQVAPARTATAKIATLRTGLATLERVEVRLDWPAQAEEGHLRLAAGRIDAPDLGYAYRDVVWQCPLRRDGAGGWRCEGEVRAGGAAPMRLGVDLGTAFTEVVLRRGESRLEVHRNAAAPDDTRVDLVQVPLLWTQALLAGAWPEGRLKRGTVDARLVVSAPADRPLRISGPLTLSGGGLETPDATIAAEGLGGRFGIDLRFAPRERRFAIDGELRGGEFLFGNAYVALPPTPVGLRIEAIGDAAGWRLPAIEWRDGDALASRGEAALAPDGTLRRLDLAIDSEDLKPVTDRYLSGWLGAFGLSALGLKGGLRSRLQFEDEGLRGFDVRFDDVSVREGGGKFAFDGLDGDVRFSAGASVDSALRWRGGRLYGLDFGAASLPLRSADGTIGLSAPAAVPAIGGSLRFDRFQLRPPSGERRLEAGFGLTLDALDVGTLAKSLGWPAFRGSLSGRIPDARYAEDRLVFEGGLDMRVFDGRVRVSSLAMERPFGVAPTLSADLALEDLDLLAVTEVFDFGSISGRLHGGIRELRLVDWTATAFDAELHTEPKRGVRQRISQRAVQNISSVGDASFVTSLQGQLIALFDDFGYRRIGIACRLQNGVCAMAGLGGAAGSGSDSGGFTIVEGAGVPRLNVVGFNRRVDWPTLLERLEAIGSGDVKPVVE